MRLMLALAALALSACPAPKPTPTDAGDDDAGVDAGVSGTFCEPPLVFVENVAGCQHFVDDYLPRVSNSSTDTWPACISDSNVFTPIDPNSSSTASVTAFEDLATLLWRDGGLPEPQAFLDARAAFAVDQVQPREDVHYPAAPSPCGTAGIPEQYPDRCAGLAKLSPLLSSAFAAGASGEMPRVHAARIEAALTWFFYLSALSEVMSCTTEPRDCDASWVSYSGGTPRDAPQALGKLVRALGKETHDRVYDAELAVRCWRNLDNETGVATDTARRDLAFAQLDRSLLRGVALLLRQRAKELTCTTGDVRDARFAFVTTLGPFLDRAARDRDVAAADVLEREVHRASAPEVEVNALVGALDTLFPCP